MSGRKKAGPRLLGLFGLTTIDGRVLSQYEVVRRIGEGGMGQVYKAWDLRLKRHVAIKVLPHWARRDTRARRRFLNEAQAASRFSHPNIVTVHEFATIDDLDLMVMELLQGRLLSDMIPARGFSVNRALVIAIQIAEALATAHNARILHHDLKPGNVMVLSGDKVKLLDFGLARPLSCHNGRGDHGTRAYMAPEQLAGDPCGPAAEIFTFGIILHQLLSGRHPFARTTLGETIEAIQTKTPTKLPAKVPPILDRVVLRCLAKSAPDRYSSMAKVLADINSCRLAPGPAAAKIIHKSSSELMQTRALIERIIWENVAQSGRALRELAHRLRMGVADKTRRHVISELRDRLILHPTIPLASSITVIREIRALAMGTLLLATSGDVAQCFRLGDLERQELFGASFAGCSLRHFNLDHTLLEKADLENCNLTKASLRGAYIRNANFAGAVLTDADFTDADWFNAVGLTEAQLLSVLPNTLLPCPPDIAAFHKYLSTRYAIPFESWDASVQRQLAAAWREHLRPGGLRERVNTWQKKVVRSDGISPFDRLLRFLA